MMIIIRKTIGPWSIYERRPKPFGATKYVVAKQGEADMHDFGKLSTAIRWVKRQLPRPPPHIVIDADTKTAVATAPVDYTIIDGPHRFNNAAVVNPAKVEELLGPES